MNSLIARYHPRTLWLQTLLLLIGSVTVASIVTGPVLLSSFENVALTEMEKKGKATVQTLAKDYELRLAISLRDAGQADPILRSLSATDDDIRYVAITKGREVISVAPAQIGKDEIVSHLDQFFAGAQAQSARSEIRRFTQVIMSQKSAFEGDPLLGGEVSKPKEEPGFVVLGLYSKRTQSKVLPQTAASVAAASLCLFMVVILLYLRWVAVRMDRMVSFAKAVADGQLQQRLDDPLNDELGQLAHALSAMTQRTSDIVAEMIEASRALASSASELLDSSTRQAQNANQQATSVTQMGATVAELRQTFSEATSKAESVIDLARRSEESSKRASTAWVTFAIRSAPLPRPSKASSSAPTKSTPSSRSSTISPSSRTCWLLTPASKRPAPVSMVAASPSSPARFAHSPSAAKSPPPRFDRSCKTSASPVVTRPESSMKAVGAPIAACSWPTPPESRSSGSVTPSCHRLPQRCRSRP